MSEEAENRELAELDRDVSRVIGLGFALMGGVLALLLLILWRVW